MKNILRKHDGGASIGANDARRLKARRILQVVVSFFCFALLFPIFEMEQRDAAQSRDGFTYLPLITHTGKRAVEPVIHIPYINDDNSYNFSNEMGIFWFGKVTPTDNYTDVRVGHNRYTLVVDVASIDQKLWYDASNSPSKARFRLWDSVSLYLSVLDTGQANPTLYRLDAMTSWNIWNWKDRFPYQAAYKWNGVGWEPTNLEFTTDHFYNGTYNDAGEDEGWNITYRVHFLNLGLSEPPASSVQMRMGVVVYDKDAASVPAWSKSWPDGFQESQGSSYRKVDLGYPAFRRPSNPVAGIVTIKQNSRTSVEDASVGGHTSCGNNGFNKWTEWGERVYVQASEKTIAVIQNQRQIFDWPCFSRYYITFPLDSIPPGKVILSAKLSMTHFGGSDISKAPTSNIQVFRIDQAWDPKTISWNNAPQAVENFPGTIVPPFDVQSTGSPGVVYQWDVSKALTDVYGTGQPLRLALYSSDFPMHSGKYFRSSETADWGGGYPPKLTIEWGNP
jgi:hypothetical protein